MQPDVKQWLLPAVDGCEMCWHIAMYAVSGHHPKVGRAAPTPNDFQEEARAIEVYVNHPDFKSCLQLVREWFGLDQDVPDFAGLLAAGVDDSLMPKGVEHTRRIAY